MSDDEVYLTIQEVSEMTGMSISTLRSYQQQGIGPPYYKFTPKMIKYKEHEVREWFDKHKNEDGE